jgi:condensin complex subunit 2
MYKRVIRMNAENRINASNSWNLKLIDNIDKFLLDEDATDTASEDDYSSGDKQTQPGKSTTTTTLPSRHGRVNFTKASCTLDASVKIYSYRVDDVHLTSYKVLANLHRTDNNNNNGKNKKKGAGSNDDDNIDGNDESGSNKTKARSNSSNKPAGPTLESNLGTSSSSFIE